MELHGRDEGDGLAEELPCLTVLLLLGWVDSNLCNCLARRGREGRQLAPYK